MPRANGSRLLLISGVKSGAIWSEKALPCYCHTQNCTKPSYSITGQYLTVQKHYVSYRESHEKRQSLCTEVALICCCARVCKKSSFFFYCCPYKIHIVSIIVTAINRNGASLASHVVPSKYFFPSISKYFKMMSKVLYYKFLLAVAKVSGIIIFISTAGFEENCSFAV